MESCVFIIIDSGFSLEVMQKCRVIAAWDLSDDRKFESDDYLTPAQIEEYAGDFMGHGTIVLERLLRIVPNAQVILISAFAELGARRTMWDEGEIVHPGWSEGYVWAAETARLRKMTSVANCSFGGFWHACDGTGWEAAQLGRYSGPGKSGHVVVAAAGMGDARPIHGRLCLLGNESKTFVTDQDGDVEYNFWVGLGQESARTCGWAMEAWKDGNCVFASDSDETPTNMWNGRQQMKCKIYGPGRVQFEWRRTDANPKIPFLKIDLWAEAARLRNWINAEMVGEPACFSSVIAVGLEASTYCPTQRALDSKPDMLLPGGDQLSFRLPEVVAAIGALLNEDPSLDLTQVKAKLGKFPEPEKFYKKQA